MKDKQLLARIVLNPKVMVGKPVVQGTRLTVDFILHLLAHGTTEAEILNEYGGLTYEDIQACLLFQSLRNFTLRFNGIVYRKGNDNSHIRLSKINIFFSKQFFEF